MRPEVGQGSRKVVIQAGFGAVKKRSGHLRAVLVGDGSPVSRHALFVVGYFDPPIQWWK